MMNLQYLILTISQLDVRREDTLPKSLIMQLANAPNTKIRITPLFCFFSIKNLLLGKIKKTHMETMGVAGHDP
jgi:hypothetical protein